MGTAATVTKLSGLYPVGKLYEGIFSLALDSTDNTGIQTVDLTPYFSYVYSLEVADNDTLADNGYKIQGICPAYSTAITSTNVAISVHQSDDAVDPLDAVASAALTTIGALKIIVKGRAAV